MLDDIEQVAQSYIGCSDCYYGYDLYDQSVVIENMTDYGIVPIGDNVKILPRFSRCKKVVINYKVNEYIDLPRGIINCITLIGCKDTDKIKITYYGYVLYNIIGRRTMVFVPNIYDILAGLWVSKFSGILIAHYVELDDNKISDGKYRVAKKIFKCGGYVKYIVFNKNMYGHSMDDLQTMWNYVYPGKRPKNKFLVHGQPSTTGYNRCYNRDYDTTANILYSCNYNELIVKEGSYIMRFG